MTADPNVPDPFRTKRMSEEFLILTDATVR